MRDQEMNSVGVEDDPKVEAVAETACGKGSASSARAVAHSHFPDGSESIAVGAVEFRSESVTGDTMQRQDFQGRPARNEEDVLQVCRALRAALQREGEIWGPFSLPLSAADDADAIAENDAGAVLRVQVTRVERTAWGTLARDHQATLQRSTEKLTADIRTAIESKLYPPAQRSKLLLALDAIRSPGYVHGPVVMAFLANHRQWAASLGYQAIWLVGPTTALTYRLC